MKVYLAQMDPHIGDLEGNSQKILAAIERARTFDSEIVLFPEMTICGYMPSDLVLHHAFIDAMEEMLDKIVAASKGIAVVVGLIRRGEISTTEKDLYNSAAIIDNGKLLGFYDKWLLPTYNVFNERRYFARGKEVKVWEINGHRVGVVICEDMWQNAGEGTYPYDPIAEMVPLKPDILLNLTASPFDQRKFDVRLKVCAAAAKTLKCPVFYACQVGLHDQIVFDGYSMYVDADQQLKAVAKGFDEDEVVIDTEENLRTIPFNPSREDDIHKALVMAVRDYFIKTGYKKAVIGISGGIDSAVVACIAAQALGPKNVFGVNLSSRYSSKEGIEDAKRLAETLGIEYQEHSIEPMFELALNELHETVHNDQEGLVKQNLQARIRGMMLMSMANADNRLLIQTSNKSEIAIGYTTLYGDMCGAFSPLGDVVKTLVYQLARYINRDTIQIPPRILARAPSAELAPEQTDQDTLPSYEEIDAVIEGYVEQSKSVEEIAEWYHIERPVVESIIRKIYNAEFKRRQAPPSIRVTTRAFDIGRNKPLMFRSGTRVY
jgi:NAD+ synthase (glutamine-hydrolysing)